MSTPAATQTVTQTEAPAATDTTSQDAGETAAGAQEEVDDINLEELVGPTYDEHPDLKGGHKGLPDYRKILEHLPENGRKLVGNLRASYTQKTQEIAALKAQLEQERVALQRDRELMTKSEFAAKVKEQAEAPLQHDPWSDEGLQERVQKEAAQMMQKMLAPLQQDLETQKRQMALDSFKSQHPDLTSDDIRVPVAKLLVDRPELKLEDAYFIVKGQLARQQADAAKAAQREILKKTSTGNAVRNAAPPKFKDAWSAYNYWKANGTK